MRDVRRAGAGARGVRRRAAAGRAGAFAAALLAAGACVAIETAPGGVQSVRLEGTPPSVVAGDTLRDSAGAPTLLRVLAFDENDRPVTTAQPRFAYVPLGDTSASAVDTALVVDPATGFVRATLPLARPQGRVAVVVGDRLQLLDTLEIVVAPDSLVPDAATIRELRYDCTDPRTGAFADTGTGAFAYNTVVLPSVVVRGDSAGRRVGVRSRLMRWDVDSGPFPAGAVPRVALTAGSRDSVPAIAVIAGAADRLHPLDTTSAAGVSSVRLRIRPSALGRDVVPEREFTVRVRGRGQPGPVALRNDPVYYRVRLSRNPTPPTNSPATCQ